MKLKPNLIVFLILFVCCNQLIIAQTAKSLVRFNISTNANYRLLSNTSNDNVAQSLINSRNNIESALLNSSFEINYSKRFKEAWWISSGFGLTHMGYKTKVDFMDLRFEQSIDATRGFVNDTKEGEELGDWMKIKQKFRYISVPVLLTYRSSTSKTFRPTFTFGSEYGRLVGSATTNVQKMGVLSYKRTTRSDNYEYSKDNVFARLAYGYEFLLADGMSVSAEIHTRIGLLGIVKDKDIQGHLNQAGFQIALNKVLQ